MNALDTQLKAQNNGPAWADCSRRGLRHRWRWTHNVGNHQWYHCARCPVSTFREEVSS